MLDSGDQDPLTRVVDAKDDPVIPHPFSIRVLALQLLRLTPWIFLEREHRRSDTGTMLRWHAPVVAFACGDDEDRVGQASLELFEWDSALPRPLERVE